MARTGTRGVLLLNNGSLVGSFSSLNLLGTLSAANAGNGVADVTGAGGGTGTNIATEVISGVQAGNDVTLDLTTLAHTFVAIEVVFRNGQGTTPISDWTRSGNTITVSGALSSDVYQVQYTY